MIPNKYVQPGSVAAVCVCVFSLPSHKSTYGANTKSTTRSFAGMFTFRADCSRCIMLLPGPSLYVSCTCEPCKQYSTLSPSPSLQCKCKSAGHTHIYLWKNLSWVSVTLVEGAWGVFFIFLLHINFRKIRILLIIIDKSKSLKNQNSNSWYSIRILLRRAQVMIEKSADLAGVLMTLWLYQNILMEDWLAGVRAQGWSQPWGDSQAKADLRTLGSFTRSGQSVTFWVSSKKRLTWAKKKEKWTVAQWSKAYF